MMQVLEAEVARGGPETLAALLRALPWLLARFCAALRRNRRRAGAVQRPGPVTDGAGPLASTPTHAADFDFFAVLLRPLLAQLHAAGSDRPDAPANHSDVPGHAGPPGAAGEGEPSGGRKRRRRTDAAPAAGEPPASKRARRAHDMRPAAAPTETQKEPQGWRWVAAAEGAARLVEALRSTGARACSPYARPPRRMGQSKALRYLLCKYGSWLCTTSLFQP